MNYINFNSSDVYYLSFGSWIPGGSDIAVNPEKIACIQGSSLTGRNGEDLLSVYILNDEAVANIIYVKSDAAAIAEVKALADFVTIPASQIFAQSGPGTDYSNKNSFELVLNSKSLVQVTASGQASGESNLSILMYNIGGDILTTYITEGAGKQLSNGNPPVNNGQLTLLYTVDTVTDNYMFYVVNHTTGTIKNYVTDIPDNGDWPSYEFIQNGGIVLRYFDTSTYVNKFYFINVDGDVIDYVAHSNAYDYDFSMLSQKSIILATYEYADLPLNTTVKYFDGTTVKTLEFAGVSNVNYGTNWDDASKDRSTILRAYYDATDEWITYLLRPNGELINIMSFADDNNHIIYTDINAPYFIAYNEVEGYLNDFKIFTENGNLIYTTNLLGYQVNNDWDTDFTMGGDFNTIWYNTNNVDTPWLLINYCAHTNKLTIGTHERGNNFDQVQVYISSSSWWNARNYNSKRDSFVCVFNNGWDDSGYGNMQLANYIDITWLNHEGTAFNTYTIADNNYTWIELQSSLYASVPQTHFFEDGSEDFVKHISLKPTSATVINIEAVTADNLNFIQSADMSEGTVTEYDVNSTTDRTWIVFNSEGVVFQHTTSLSWSWDGPSWDTVVVLDDDDYTNSFIYSFALGELDFPVIPENVSNFVVSTDLNFASLEKYRPTKILLTAKDGANPTHFYRIDERGVNRPIVNTKSNDGSTDYYRIGATTINYAVYNDSSSTWWVYQWDWTSGQLTSIVNTLNNTTYAREQRGDRTYWTVPGEGTGVAYFLTRKGLISQQFDNNQWDDVLNDVVWWD